MASKKKAAKRVYKVTLEMVKEKLESGGYPSVGGARKAAAYLSPTDKEAALKLIAKKFGDSGDKPAKRNVKAAAAPAEAPKKRGRPKKLPYNAEAIAANKAAKEAAAAAAAAPAAEPAAQPPKRRGRPPKVKTEQAATPATRDPDMVAPARSKTKKEPDQLTAIANVMGPLESALRILEKANNLAGGTLSTTGFQDIADTATAAVRAMQPHMKSMVPQDPPPPPLTNGQMLERPFDPALLAAAAESAGLPFPTE